MRSTKEDTIESAGAARRSFITMGLAGGLSLFAGTAAAASASLPAAPCTESNFLPGPADALVDFLSVMYDIEGNILGPYFKSIGSASNAVTAKYSELQQAVKEFKLLAPSYAQNGFTSPISNVVAMALAIRPPFVTDVSLAETASLVQHADVVLKSSDAIKEAACNCEPGDKDTTLSPAAARKLHQILAIIAALEPAVNEVDAASRELTEVSNRLRVQVQKISTSVRAAINDIVNSDIAKQSGGAGADELKQKAIAEIRAASAVISELEGYKVPANLTKYSVDNSAQNYRTPLVVLRQMLDGTASWVQKGDPTAKAETGEVRFTNAGYSPAAYGAWDLWYAVQKVLVDVIPLATNGRVWQLYGRKLMAYGYPARDQYHIFYSLIVNLSPPSNVDLADNPRLREKAAKKLAEL